MLFLTSRVLSFITCLVVTSGAVVAADAKTQATSRPTTRKADVIYGRSFGTALTMDLFTPTEKPNGAAVIAVVSGGWFSAPDVVSSPYFAAFIRPLTDRGYTVFAVVHGSQPKFQIPEAIDNLNRSVRFIRAHASDYGVDPNRIGITGGSAGGHLSLMQGLAPQPEKPDAPDPIDRVSAKVQAVACFFPPTDFLNYGKPGENALGTGILAPFAAAFDFHEFSTQAKKFVPITDENRRNEIAKQISPFYHATADDPPTMIIHGDADALVPIQQGQIVIDKLKELKVPAELVVKPGAGHGWGDLGPDMARIADWFDQHLK